MTISAFTRTRAESRSGRRMRIITTRKNCFSFLYYSSPCNVGTGFTKTSQKAHSSGGRFRFCFGSGDEFGGHSGDGVQKLGPTCRLAFRLDSPPPPQHVSLMWMGSEIRIRTDEIEMRMGTGSKAFPLRQSGPSGDRKSVV